MLEVFDDEKMILAAIQELTAEQQRLAAAIKELEDA